MHRENADNEPHLWKPSTPSQRSCRTTPGRVAAGLIFIMVVCVSAAAQDTAASPDLLQRQIDLALNRMFNCDFAGAQAIFAEEIRNYPNDPLLYAHRASALLFSEFDRMKILELDFFEDDDSVTDRKRLKPDASVRADFFQATGNARKLASERLAADPNDTDAILAMFIAVGVETDYTLLVEKKYLRSYSLTKENQIYARKLLALNPPLYDAYLFSGMLEYVVGNLNFFFKLFVRFDQIKGNKQLAVDYLKRVIDHGRYYAPYAKILLSVMYLRDKKSDLALALLKELERDFPENALVRKEVIRISARINLSRKGSSPR